MQTPPPPTGGSGRLDENRGLLIYFLLTILTCGIYGYYFLYKMAKDVNVACMGDGKTTPGLVKLILLSFLTCGFYAIYWEYSLADRVYCNAPRYGVQITENGGTFLLWYILGAFLCGLGSLFAVHILFKNVNTICTAYNRYNGL